ncbi:MAG: membrane protein insertase YidC [Candidatus Firestonebacteria bacterium]
MEKRLILAIVLSMVVLFVFNMQSAKNQKPIHRTMEVVEKEKELKPQEQIIKEKQVVEVKKEIPKGKKMKLVGEEVTLETKDVIVKFDTRGAIIKSWGLKDYKEDGKNIDIIWHNEQNSSSCTVEIPSNNFNDNLIYSYKKSDLAIEFTGDEKNNVAIKKIYTFSPSGFKADCEISIKNLDKDKKLIQNTKVYLGTGINNYIPSSKDIKVKKETVKLIYEKLGTITNIAYVNDKVINNKLKEGEEKVISDDTFNWVGIKDKYFIFVFITKQESKFKGFVQTLKFEAETDEISNNILAYEMPACGFILPDFNGAEEKSFKFSFYAGPLLIEQLKRADPFLYKTLDFGWFGWLGLLLLVILKFFYNIFHNYGMAIIFLTILTKIILWWPTQASYKSLKRMQELQPHIKTIKERHKNDMPKMNEEMMKLYKEKKINPLGGCLPLLLQMPIFFALYMILINAIELKGAPFMFWIKDLSLKDPYYILAILMGITMFIQQKMTPTTDQQQAKIMLILPFVFTFLFASLPAGVLLYWVVQNILSVVQQYIINKTPVPATT